MDSETKISVIWGLFIGVIIGLSAFLLGVLAEWFENKEFGDKEV